MFDDDDKKKDDKKKPQGGSSFPVSTWVMWIAILGGITALVLIQKRMVTPTGVTMTEAAFLQKFDANLISHAVITYNPSMAGSPITIIGKVLQTDKDGSVKKDTNGKPVEDSFIAPNVVLTPTMEDKLLPSDKVEVSVPNPMLSEIGYQLLFFVGIGVLFWFLFMRPLKMAGKGALKFCRRKA